jgi:hypothetical protein
MPEFMTALMEVDLAAPRYIALDLGVGTEDASIARGASPASAAPYHVTSQSTHGSMPVSISC